MTFFDSRKRRFFPLVAILALFALSACNTVEGLGKDIEATGDEIKDTAR